MAVIHNLILARLCLELSDESKGRRFFLVVLTYGKFDDSTMNFSPFGNPFSASQLSGIHQFAAGAQVQIFSTLN